MAASSNQLRSWWSAYRCNENRLSTVAILGDGRVWNLRVATPTVPAWKLFAQAQDEYNYYFTDINGGTYKCRPIAGKTVYSLHSYGIALDINPDENPQKRPLTHNYPPGFIKTLEGIRTKNGKQVFAWGGRWTSVAPDAMHWQINCSPADLASGLIYPNQPTPPQEDDKMIPSSWAAPSWKLAKEAGILTDDSVPRDPITVEQFIVFLARTGVIEENPATGKGRVDPDLKGSLDHIF